MNYCKIEAAADTIEGTTLVKLTDVNNRELYGVINPDDITPLIYQLLAAMDQLNPGRTVGAVLTTIIRGTLDRLRDPKNEIKGGWEGLTEDERLRMAMGEISEFRNAVVHHTYGGEDNRYYEGCDVLTTVGMFLQKLEARNVE